MDDLQQLRARHDALPDATPDGVAEARARLTAHMRGASTGPVGGQPRRPFWRPAPRRAWGLGLAGAAAAAVLVAAVAGAGGSGQDQPGGRSPVRLRPVANAQDLASNAATVAGAEGEAAPGPHQWVYVKTLSVEFRDGGGWLRGVPDPKRLKSWEQWSRVDDWGHADYRNGKLGLYKGFGGEVPYQEILALPRDPGALLARVYGKAPKGVPARPAPRGTKGGEVVRPAAEDRNAFAFGYISACMWESALPARLRAALYGALAKIPDVRYRAGAADLAGRPGVTLYRDQGGYLRGEIFIDPKTYEYLGFRQIGVEDHRAVGENLKKGDVMSWGSTLRTAIVDRPGERS